MRIEYALNPNCSEAVFRFYTLEPEKMQGILQALADEINANTGFEPHKGQRVPLFETPDEYATEVRPLTQSDRDTAGYLASDANRDHKAGRISDEERMKRIGEAYDKLSEKKYPDGALLRCCAGMGDNECIVTLEKGKRAFVLNIGNNDICENRTGWIQKVMEMGIQVEEAERSELLAANYARDCTCGVRFFPDTYDGLITDGNRKGGRERPRAARR